jgi:hypothetical protein
MTGARRASAKGTNRLISNKTPATNWTPPSGLVPNAHDWLRAAYSDEGHIITKFRNTTPEPSRLNSLTGCFRDRFLTRNLFDHCLPELSERHQSLGDRAEKQRRSASDRSSIGTRCFQLL